MNVRTLFPMLLAFACIPAVAQEPSKVKNGQIAVFVTGEVNHRGVYTLPEGASVTEAIKAAGGATDDANLRRVELVRGVGQDKPKSTIIDATKEAGSGSKTTVLFDRDSLVVGHWSGSRMY